MSPSPPLRRKLETQTRQGSATLNSPRATTVQLALTFEIVSGVAPSAVFYIPAIDRLVTVIELN